MHSWWARESSYKTLKLLKTPAVLPVVYIYIFLSLKNPQMWSVISLFFLLVSNYQKILLKSSFSFLYPEKNDQISQTEISFAKTLNQKSQYEHFSSHSS